MTELCDLCDEGKFIWNSFDAAIVVLVIHLQCQPLQLLFVFVVWCAFLKSSACFFCVFSIGSWLMRVCGIIIRCFARRINCLFSFSELDLCWSFCLRLYASLTVCLLLSQVSLRQQLSSVINGTLLSCSNAVCTQVAAFRPSVLRISHSSLAAAQCDALLRRMPRTVSSVERRIAHTWAQTD